VGEKFHQESMIISMKWQLQDFQPARAKAHGLFSCCVIPFHEVPEGFLFSLSTYSYCLSGQKWNLFSLKMRNQYG
jgi:hypothetical protein